jgi:dTDP-4-amino-4,6-dideoxygalactose transaminase
MVVTNDDDLARRVRLLRHQGDGSVVGGPEYHHPIVGYNSRLDEMQAAILRVKLPHLDAWNRQRAQHAETYRRLLAGSGLEVPAVYSGRSAAHVYCVYTIRCRHRDALRKHLRMRRIGHKIYYPLPLHLQEAYAPYGFREGDLPIAEQLARDVISIPIYPELMQSQIEQVAAAILEFVEAHQEAAVSGVTSGADGGE